VNEEKKSCAHPSDNLLWVPSLKNYVIRRKEAKKGGVPAKKTRKKVSTKAAR